MLVFEQEDISFDEPGFIKLNDLSRINALVLYLKSTTSVCKVRASPLTDEIFA